ncbi:MAG: hypothetical protein AAF721_31255, partial [Myxococcota bacterium]
MGWAAALSVSLVVATVSTAASASDPPASEPASSQSIASFEEPLEKQLGGSLEMGVAARRELPPPPAAGIGGADPATQQGPREIASLSPMLRMNLRVRNEVELYASGGLVSVFTNSRQGQESSARPSNIAFGGRRVWEFSGSKYRAADAGFEFAIPTGYARTDDELDAYEYALASRGGLGPWEWMPRTLSMVVPAGVSAQVFKRWVLESRGALAAMFPSIGDVDRPTVAAQISAGARWVLPWLAVGVRTSAVYNGRH